MQLSLYLALRWRYLVHHLQLLLGQLQQLMLGALVILGPVMAAVLLLLVLALGMLYRADLPAAQAMLLTWCLLCAQSLLLWLCREAILLPSHQLFLQSLPVPRWGRRATDGLLLLCCHPLWLLHALIISQANFSQWQQVLPQLGVFVLQLLFAVVLLYRGIAVLLWLLVSLPLLVVLPVLTSTPWPWLLGLLAAGLLMIGWRASHWQGWRPLAHSPARFWLSVWCHQPAQLLSTVLLVLLLLLIVQITLVQRPDLVANVTLLLGCLLLLISGSWQLNVGRQSADMALFLRQFPAALSRWQYAAPVTLTLLAVLLPAVIFQQWQLCWQLLPVVLSVWVAKRQPKFFIASWFGGSLLAALWF